MTPAQILVEEHIEILKGLALIEKAILTIKKNNNVDKEFWAEMIDFLRGFADKCHHAKEEKYFLPALKEKGSDKYRAYIDVVFAEHELGRRYIKEAETAIAKYYSDDTNYFSVIEENFTDYIVMLRAHIQKENRYFVKAEKDYLQDDIETLKRDFEKTEKEEIGEGVHDKYLSILRKNQERIKQ